MVAKKRAMNENNGIANSQDSDEVTPANEADVGGCNASEGGSPNNYGCPDNDNSAGDDDDNDIGGDGNDGDDDDDD